jgi:hypothetical protein
LDTLDKGNRMAYPYDYPFSLYRRNVAPLDLTQQQIISPMVDFYSAPSGSRYINQTLSDQYLRSATGNAPASPYGDLLSAPSGSQYINQTLSDQYLRSATGNAPPEPMQEAPLQTFDQADGDQQPRRTLGLLGDMFGGASALDEYMTPEQRAQLQNQGVMAAAMQLLAASGPSRTPVGLGQALGEAYGAGQKGYTAAQQNLLTSMTMKQKMDEAKAKKDMQANVSNFLSQKAPEGVDANAFKAQQYMKLADVYAASNPEQSSKFFDMAQKLMPAKEATPDDIKKLKALGLDVTLENLAKLNPSAAPQDPEGIRTLRALNLPVTLENLQSLKEEASPVEVRILKATGTPVTMENVMKLRQSGAAGGTNVSVNTGEKVRVGEINKDITEEMRNVTAQARSANETLMNVDRILPALDKAITGPLADYRTTLTRVGQQFGVVGKDANEVLANTQTLVQGLAQQELAAAGQMRGQGAITEAERALLRRAAVGDQNMSAAELRSALQTAQKTAQYRITQHQQYLSDFSRLPGNEPYMPFYTVKPYQPAGGGNAAQNAIDAELAKRAQQQRGGAMR